MTQPLVVAGASLTCAMGTTPSSLLPTPPPTVLATAPAATVLDMVPITNVPPFGLCTTPSNPAVASATSAASGVLTPMPCIPVIAGPWKPGAPKVLIANRPALTASSTCQCAWGGVITITSPGQTKALA